MIEGIIYIALISLLLGIMLLIKGRQVMNLNNDKKSLIRGLNIAAKIIGESNVKGVPPKDLEDE